MVSTRSVVFWMYKLFKGKYDFLVEENSEDVIGEVAQMILCM